MIMPEEFSPGIFLIFAVGDIGIARGARNLQEFRPA
jgi:hypothetical protein